MNGQKARELRRKARINTVGEPDKAYNRLNRGNWVLAPGCTRSVYQQFKKGYLASITA